MKKTFFLILSSTLLLSACNSDSGTVVVQGKTDQIRPGGDENCSDDCQKDDVMCDKYGTHFCGHFDDDPCYDWSKGETCDCGCDGDKCKEECPEEPEKCVSNCTEAGNTKCAGTLLKTCTEVEEGCLRWSEGKSCGAGKTCDLGECVEGEGKCEDACTKGQKECTDTGRRKCTEGEDGCTEWSPLAECADGNICKNGECEAPETPAKDECTLDAIKCNGEKYVKCVTGDNGHTVWGITTACNNGQICQNDKCITPQKDECEEKKKECSGDGYRECKKGDSGFTQWSAVTPCGTKQKCDNGACVDKCTDACSSGKTKCTSDKKGYNKCETSTEGCLAWSTKVNSCEFGCESGACKKDPNKWVPECSSNCPKVIEEFPFVTTADNTGSKNTISVYSCRTDLDESGPEDTYIFKVNEPGYVVAGVTDKGSKDVDIHLLSGLDGNKCLDRGDRYVLKHIEPGIYYITADSYQGAASAGKYQIAVQFLADSGKCGLKPTTIKRERGLSTVNLPAIGNIVLEAHIVTEHDHQIHGNNWWPSSWTEGLAEHKEHTRSLFPEYIQKQSETWCPSGEGGCEYGQGSRVNSVPDDAEAWYVCMYWTWDSIPKAGARFLVVNPFNGKTVVAAAGYETGPGGSEFMGGAVDEIHYYLGTAADDPRRIMYSEMSDANQNLPYGPITCSYKAN